MGEAFMETNKPRGKTAKPNEMVKGFDTLIAQADKQRDLLKERKAGIGNMELLPYMPRNILDELKAECADVDFKWVRYRLELETLRKSKAPPTEQQLQKATGLLADALRATEEFGVHLETVRGFGISYRDALDKMSDARRNLNRAESTIRLSDLDPAQKKAKLVQIDDAKKQLKRDEEYMAKFWEMGYSRWFQTTDDQMVITPTFLEAYGKAIAYSNFDSKLLYDVMLADAITPKFANLQEARNFYTALRDQVVAERDWILNEKLVKLDAKGKPVVSSTGRTVMVPMIADEKTREAIEKRYNDVMKYLTRVIDGLGNRSLAVAHTGVSEYRELLGDARDFCRKPVSKAMNIPDLESSLWFYKAALLGGSVLTGILVGIIGTPIGGAMAGGAVYGAGTIAEGGVKVYTGNKIISNPALANEGFVKIGMGAFMIAGGPLLGRAAQAGGAIGVTVKIAAAGLATYFASGLVLNTYEIGKRAKELGVKNLDAGDYLTVAETIVFGALLAAGAKAGASKPATSRMPATPVKVAPEEVPVEVKAAPTKPPRVFTIRPRPGLHTIGPQIVEFFRDLTPTEIANRIVSADRMDSAIGRNGIKRYTARDGIDYLEHVARDEPAKAETMGELLRDIAENPATRPELRNHAGRAYNGLASDGFIISYAPIEPLTTTGEPMRTRSRPGEDDARASFSTPLRRPFTFRRGRLEGNTELLNAGQAADTALAAVRNTKTVMQERVAAAEESGGMDVDASNAVGTLSTMESTLTKMISYLRRARDIGVTNKVAKDPNLTDNLVFAREQLGRVARFMEPATLTPERISSAMDALVAADAQLAVMKGPAIKLTGTEWMGEHWKGIAKGIGVIVVIGGVAFNLGKVGRGIGNAWNEGADLVSRPGSEYTEQVSVSNRGEPQTVQLGSMKLANGKTVDDSIEDIERSFGSERGAKKELRLGVATAYTNVANVLGVDVANAIVQRSGTSEQANENLKAVYTWFAPLSKQIDGGGFSADQTAVLKEFLAAGIKTDRDFGKGRSEGVTKFLDLLQPTLEQKGDLGSITAGSVRTLFLTALFDGQQFNQSAFDAMVGNVAKLKASLRPGVYTKYVYTILGDDTAGATFDERMQTLGKFAELYNNPMGRTILDGFSGTVGLTEFAASRGMTIPQVVAFAHDAYTNHFAEFKASEVGRTKTEDAGKTQAYLRYLKGVVMLGQQSDQELLNGYNYETMNALGLDDARFRKGLVAMAAGQVDTFMNLGPITNTGISLVAPNLDTILTTTLEFAQSKEMSITDTRDLWLYVLSASVKYIGENISTSPAALQQKVSDALKDYKGAPIELK